MAKFFTVPQTNEVPLIVAELQKQHFIQLEAIGEGNLFIDTINKTFWFCSDKAIQTNINFAKHMHNDIPEQATLKMIQSWEY